MSGNVKHAVKSRYSFFSTNIPSTNRVQSARQWPITLSANAPSRAPAILPVVPERKFMPVSFVGIQIHPHIVLPGLHEAPPAVGAVLVVVLPAEEVGVAEVLVAVVPAVVGRNQFYRRLPGHSFRLK